jgi:hypothetical protein
MPPTGLPWLPKADILSYEEITAMVAELPKTSRSPPTGRGFPSSRVGSERLDWTE